MKRIEFKETISRGYMVKVNGKSIGFVAKNFYHDDTYKKWENSEAVCMFTSLHYAARSLVNFHKSYVEV